MRRTNVERFETFLKKQVKSKKGFAIYRDGKIYTPELRERADIRPWMSYADKNVLFIKIETIGKDGSVTVESVEWSSKVYESMLE